jgi:predicted RNA-binding protein associated with RNAse of E/G family
MSEISIILARIGKPPRTYTEGFLSDNGVELRTLTELSPDTSLQFSYNWHKAGCIPKDQFVKVVRKILFYNEYFAVMQLLDSGQRSLGCYVDVVTPLLKVNGIYQLTDLILDLWIAPDGHYDELDVDEYNQAVSAGKFPPEWETHARQTFTRLKAEINRGDFPGRYIGK